MTRLEPEQIRVIKTVGLGLGLLVALLAVLFTGYGLGTSTGYFDAQADGYAVQYRQDTARRADNCFAANSVFAVKQCVSQAIATSRDQDRAEHDLNAQQQMATWAWWMLVITLAQAFVSVGALVALVHTLNQTDKNLAEAREANRIAADENIRAAGRAEATAHETAAALAAQKQSADAAAAQVRLSEETARRQLRAYIIVKTFRIAGLVAGKKPDVTFFMRNVGQTPAYDVRCYSQIFYADSLEQVHHGKLRFEKSIGPISSTVIGAGEQAETGFWLVNALDEEAIDKIQSGERYVGVFGALSYRDIFKRRRLLTFRVCLSHLALQEDGTGQLGTCARGNKAN